MITLSKGFPLHILFFFSHSFPFEDAYSVHTSVSALILSATLRLPVELLS